MKNFFRRTLKYIKHLFTEHPRSMNESYFSHALWAVFYSVCLLYAGVACFVHAIFPFLFTRTASSIAEIIVDTTDDRGLL